MLPGYRTHKGGATKVLLRWVTFLLIVAISGLTAHAEPVGRGARVVTASASNAVTVTTSADSVDGDTSSFAGLNATPGADGKLSLREALLASNATPTALLTLTISFDIPTADPGYNSTTKTWTIQVGSVDATGLPPLTRGNVHIEAATRADGPSKRPTIVLDGEQDWEDTANGLVITSANNVVRGLTITNFFDNMIVLDGSGAANNQIAGCYIGPDATGRVAPPYPYNGNSTGVKISGGAHGNLIGGDTAADRNLLAGTRGSGGVWIRDSTTYSNTVSGNWIGLDATGLASLTNEGAGVYLSGGTHHNLVGGTTDGQRNVISGNTDVFGAVWIGDATTSYNTVAGNWIGVDQTGLAALPNSDNGIYIRDASYNALIDNVISANDAGVNIRGGAFNAVAGNTIGLAADGKVKPALSNRDVGIYIIGGAHHNLIGGTTVGQRNIISNNGASGGLNGHGIYLSDAQTISNTIQGNYIGVDRSGLLPAGNLGYGILMSYNAAQNTVGGDLPEARNVIAYNGFGGIWLNTDKNYVAHNFVGVGADSKTGLGNQQDGIRISGHYNTIGPDNLIAYNQRSGIRLNGTFTTIISNELSYNSRSGICIEGNTPGMLEKNHTNVISNVITYNGLFSTSGTACEIESGVVITGTDDTNVLSNTILHNQGAGITVLLGSDNRISANSISGNDGAGIKLLDGGNANLAPPFNLHATPGLVSGRSCVGCTIEVFNDDEDEGEQLLGITKAIDGAFTLSIQANTLTLAHITATSTDESGNTSPFAPPVTITNDPPPPVYTIWLPQIQSP